MDDFHIILSRHLAKGTGAPGGSRKRWSTKDLAAACGVSHNTVRNWRGGDNPPTEPNMSAIEIALFGTDPAKETVAYAERQELRAAFEATRNARTGTIEPMSVAAKFSKLPVRVPTLFLGREQQLAQIAALLNPTNGRVAPVILFGMRGVGKSTLAAAYADAHHTDYRFVWSIRAESAVGMCEGLNTLGQRLGWDTGRGNLELAAQSVLDRLAQEDRSILLIFDNAENPRSIAPFLPRGGECHVIITSNSYAWRGVGTPVEIDIWPPQIGARFLTERSGKHSATSAAERLSIVLEGLPLAHEVAAATCENTTLSIDGYLESFAANPAALLSDDRYSPVDYYGGVAVARAFEMAIEAANRIHPSCAILISYASYLPDIPIPHCFFALGLQHLGEELRGSFFSEDELAEVLAVLKSFALVKESTAWPCGMLESGQIAHEMHMHRLIRIVSSNYAIKSGIITDSPEEKLMDILKAAFEKCDHSYDDTGERRRGNYDNLFYFLLLLETAPEFVSKLSSESEEYIYRKFEEHVQTS